MFDPGLDYFDFSISRFFRHPARPRRTYLVLLVFFYKFISTNRSLTHGRVLFEVPNAISYIRGLFRIYTLSGE